MEERLWTNLFEQPWNWRDNRATKVYEILLLLITTTPPFFQSCPNFPDFKHSSTGAGLWIDSRSLPSWVPLKLASKSSRNAAAADESNQDLHRRHRRAPILGKRSGSGADSQTLEKFQRLHRHGQRPSIGIILAALKVCTANRDLESGRIIHDYVAASGDLASTTFVPNTLVDMYAKCGSLAEARHVFDSIQTPTVVSWSALILGYAQSGDGGAAWDLYSRMQRTGCAPNRVTLLAALRACSAMAETEDWKLVDGLLLKPECLRRGRSVHLRAIETGSESDPFVESSLVDMYWRCGSMPDARRVFDRRKHHDVVAWNAIILGYAHNGDGELAMAMYSRMRDEGCDPDRVTILAALRACSCIAEDEDGIEHSLEQGRSIHELAKKLRCDTYLAVANSLVDMYAKCGIMEDALRIFERIEQRSVVSWNCIVAGYVQSGEATLALEFFRRMEEEGFDPDAVTFVAVLKACGILGNLDLGREIHARVSNEGFDDVPAVANALVDFYAKSGSISDAEDVFESATKKSLVTWSSLMAAYSFQGDTEYVFRLFDRMLRELVQPDHVTFLLLLSACRYAGLVDKAKTYFRSMSEEFRIVPGIQHYTCLVDVLAQSNHLDEAVTILRNMPLKPDVVIWMVLLDACAKRENVTIGELAFESVLELDPSSASAHVLMSNIYAAAGMPREATRIQSSLENTLKHT